MVAEADEVGDELEITRADMDKCALRSHELAIQATDEGRLPEEIVPVTIKSKKGDTTVEIDEAPRRDTSLETLAKLPALFVKDGSHTAGNAPGVNDGAGALVLASDEWAKANGRPVLATIVAQAAVADDFPYLARTPANATKAALEKAGLSVDDIDLFEINEAFASVALNSMRMLGVDESKVNVNGGAIALGHPIGASGARILMTLVNELRRRGGGLGVRGDLLRRRPGRRRDRRGQRGLQPRRSGRERRRLLRPRQDAHGGLHRPSTSGAPPTSRAMLSRRAAGQGRLGEHQASACTARNDADTDALRQRILDALAGQRVVDLQRLGAGRARRDPAAALPRDARARPTAIRTPGGPPTSSPPPRRSWPRCSRTCWCFDGGIGMRSEVRDGVYTGRPDGPFTYREGKAEAIRELAGARGHRPRRVVRVLGLRVRPADAARGRPPGGRQPRLRAREGRPRRRAGAIMRFDRLAPMLKIGGAALAVALVGGGGGYAAARLRPRRRRGACSLR